MSNLEHKTGTGTAMALVFAIAAGLFASAVAADSKEVSFRAVAVNMSNVGRTGARPLDIAIERWTTDQELATLKDALVEKGSDQLMKQVQKIKPRAGYIRAATGGLGWDIQYARRTELPDGGYRVVFATDRPMSFFEAANRPRTAEYDFLLGELRIRPDGKGEGKLVPMAKISYNQGTRVIEIENYANEPVRLTDVTEQKAKASRN